jgi:hypothetical protein
MGQTLSLMQSDDFLRQVVMDGRANALTFVGTASDDLDLASAIDEFELDEDASMIDAILARNQAARQEVKSQLEDYAVRLGDLAHEQRESAAKLGARLNSSQVFTVSAREFLRLSGLAKTNSSGCDDISQTEVPALVDHMRQICAGYGVSAHCQALQSQLHVLLREIKQEVRSQQAMIRSRVEVSQRGREEIRAAVEAAQTFLKRDVGDARERLVQALEADQALLGERVKRAVERAKLDLDQTFAKWRRMHWATIKAACRRGGTHVGSSGRTDFPEDLAKPILDGIAFAWSDFFGEKLSQTLEKWTNHLLFVSEGYRGRLAKSVRDAAGDSADLTKSLKGLLETTERILKELLAQTKNSMDAKILENQRTLYESVPIHIRENMHAAFDQAAQESGAGMKDRMVKILSEHASRVAGVMFDDSREAILAGVRGLGDWLVRDYDKMIDAVIRSAGLAAQNLVTGDSSITEEVLATELSKLEESTAVIERLEGLRR